MRHPIASALVTIGCLDIGISITVQGWAAVRALHLSLGVGADVLLGAQLPDAALADPALDSQNRFYGVAFALYGLLLYRCALDLRAGAPILRIVIWTFFAAGLARIVSIATHGVPPPLLHLWLSKVLRTTS